MKDDEAKAKLEQLFEIQDPNEIIGQYRVLFAEANSMAENELFPFADDSAGDVIEGFIGAWLALRAKLPIKSKEQVVDSINDLIELLKEERDYVAGESWEIERDVRRYLRKGLGRIFK